MRVVSFMSQTPAQLAASKKYHQEKLDELKLRVPKGQKAHIVEHAKRMGESTNAFLFRAVNEAIERDNQNTKTD